MQAQVIFVFLAHALVLVNANAQESIDANCERYASRIGVFASCDAREFFEPAAPPSDIGLESALSQRLRSSEPNDSESSEAVSRTEDLPTGNAGAG
jgi:hypothetical protein